MRALIESDVDSFAAVLDGLADAVVVLDSDTRLLWANHAAERLFGLSREASIGMLGTEFVHPDDLELAGVCLTTVPAQEVGASVEVRVRAEGSWRLVEVVGSPVSFGGVESVALCIRDLTERRRRERAGDETAAIREDELKRALSVLNATLDSTADGILIVDADGKITSHNRCFAEMWQLPDHILASGDDNEAIEYVVSQLREPDAFVRRVLETYAQPEIETHDTIEFLDGRVFERLSRPQRIGDSIVGRVWAFHDVTDRKRLEDDLSHQAFHDSLTGLANQALFVDRLEHAVVRSTRSADDIAVLFMDLDAFKTVNDSLGHAAGDRLLIEVAARLQGCLRDSDTAARLGGDEFAVLVENLANKEQAVAVARRIIREMQRPIMLDGKEVTPSLSIGIAYCRRPADAHQLLRNADLAMYTAKGRGRGEHAVFEESMHVAAMDRLELEADLRGAIRRGELTVAYQPIVELSTGRVLAVEALARWEHPKRGPISPVVFIPLAEDTGVIGELGDFVLRTATAQLRAWQDETGPDTCISMSVNLSPSQLLDPSIVPQVARLVRQHALRPGQLILEITEGAMMTDTETAERTASALKAAGVRLAVDDFGTGYSSLTHLQRFPIDIVKIDRSFVQAVDTGPEDAALTKAIVHLAQTLKLSVVAEGVETVDQAEALAALGCQLAQGFLMARPMTAADVSRILSGAVPIPSPLSRPEVELTPN
jgi:diguanylate cyclase (GGDEF)-like protein/PAS domain S-box-containing protein